MSGLSFQVAIYLEEKNYAKFTTTKKKQPTERLFSAI
jgi:hypothetical protein